MSVETARQQIRSRLGKNPFASDADQLIDVYLARADHWRVEIYVRDKSGKLLGSRDLSGEGADCSAIEAASVLAIALAIDPEAALRPAPSTPPPIEDPQPPVASSAPPVVCPAPAPAPSHPAPQVLGSSASIRAGAGGGLLANPSLSVSLGVDWRVGFRTRATAEALWMPEVRASDDRFGFGLSAIGLGACMDVWSSPSADLSACPALWAGTVHAVVHELVPTEPGDRAWFAASLAPRLRAIVVEPLVAELGVHVVVPLTRYEFAVTGWTEPVYRQPSLSVLGFGGLGISF